MAKGWSPGRPKRLTRRGRRRRCLAGQPGRVLHHRAIPHRGRRQLHRRAARHTGLTSSRPLDACELGNLRAHWWCARSSGRWAWSRCAGGATPSRRWWQLSPPCCSAARCRRQPERSSLRKRTPWTRLSMRRDETPDSCSSPARTGPSCPVLEGSYVTARVAGRRSCSRSDDGRTILKDSHPYSYQALELGKLVELGGLEPPTPCLQSKCSSS